MDDELFDDSFDVICSQVEISLIENVDSKDDKNVFKVPSAPKKQPVYSINKLAQQGINRSNQVNNQVKNQTGNQYSNQNKNQTNKVNTTVNRPNQPQSNKPNNQLNNLSNQNNQVNRSNHLQNLNKSSNANPYLTTVNKTVPGNNLNNNLTKSILAQNQNCKYSVNKQNLTLCNTALKQNQFKNQQINKPLINNQKNTVQSINKSTSNQKNVIQQTPPNTAFKQSNNNTINSTIKNSQSTHGFSQVTVPSSQISSQKLSQSQANHSSFSISQSVLTEVSVNPALKALNNQLEVDPSDKYLGQILILKSQLKKYEAETKKKDEKIQECERKLKEQKEEFEKKMEAKKLEEDFNNSQLIAKGFKESVSNMTINKSMLERTISSISNNLKRSSPKKKADFQEETLFARIPEFNNLSIIEDDNVMVPETQPFFYDNAHQDTNFQKIKDEPIDKTELDLSVIPPTQLDNQTVYFKQENVLFEDTDDEDEVPPTQYSPVKSIKHKSSNINNESIKKESKTELKRIKLEQEDIFKDDAVFHQPHFKFIDFEVYDNLYEEKRINYIKENLNPNFDHIIEELINLDMHIQFSNSFEFKFAKLNEEFILLLLNLDPKTHIPELTFILLANLNECINYLNDKELLSKLTNKCFVLNKTVQEKDYEYGHTLWNKMLEIFSSCRAVNESDSEDCLRTCYSIILFLINNTVEKNNIAEFHKFPEKIDQKQNCQEKDDQAKEEIKCTCWSELHDVLGQFALYLMEIFDQNKKLHHLIVKDLTKFIINFNRTKSQPKGWINYSRFIHFAQKNGTKN